jgi:hypothetical protein
LPVSSLFVSLVYCVESTVRWFVVREKHCWMAADSADKSKRTGRRIRAAWNWSHAKLLCALPNSTSSLVGGGGGGGSFRNAQLLRVYESSVHST